MAVQSNQTAENQQSPAPAQETKSNKKQIRRRPRRRRGKKGARGPQRLKSLDGLRALALIAVVCYHVGVPFLPSGHIGVVMFLVLSGYLITSSLLRTVRGGIKRLPGFWGKRLARIWLPMAFMIALVILACAFGNRILFTKARPDVLPSLGLFENISYILRNVSYFDTIGGPSPLLHLWYLGVDAQFCIVWSIIMTLSLAILPGRATTRKLTFILAIASAALMGFLYVPGSDITRIYYGTDTRAFAPLIGAWLAFAMPVGRRAARDVRPFIESHRRLIDVASVISLLVLIVGMVVLSPTSPILYRGGMFLAALLTAIIIADIVMPSGILVPLFSMTPLTWLGRRSLGIYLWHYPLLRLFSPAVGDTTWPCAIAAIALSLVLNEITYRFVERPFSGNQPIKRISRRMKNGPKSFRTKFAMTVAALVIIAVADGVALAVLPDETLVPKDAIVSTGDSPDHAMDLSGHVTGSGDSAAQELSERAADLILRSPSSERDYGIYDPVIIGDSVPGDAEEYFDIACPDNLLDSYAGRTPEQAMQVLDEYLAKNVVGKIVIMQAFSNAPCTDEQLEHMVSACGEDRSLYLVNVRAPYDFQNDNNARLAACANRYDNVHLIDWYTLSEGTTDWIYSDGEHLTPTGQPIYVNLIVDAIDEDFADRGGIITRRDTSDGITAAQDTGESNQLDDLSGVQVNERSTLRILMLGNSLTYYNNMPDMLADLTGAEVISHTRGGAHLAEQLDEGSKMGRSTLQSLAEGDWDYVVLQEQSALPIKNNEEYMNSVNELIELARAAGATPIIYATWPYQEGSERYQKVAVTPEEMAEGLRSAFRTAVDSTGALMADAQTAFENASATEVLYIEDGVHPTAVGSRLAAETIAQTIAEDQAQKQTQPQTQDQDQTQSQS